MGLRQADLPGEPACFDRGQRTGAGTAVIAGDRDMIRVCFGYTRRAAVPTPTSETSFTEIRAFGLRFQIVDQLSQILDGIDVVVWWRRYQAYAGGGVATRAICAFTL